MPGIKQQKEHDRKEIAINYSDIFVINYLSIIIVVHNYVGTRKSMILVIPSLNIINMKLIFGLYFIV